MAKELFKKSYELGSNYGFLNYLYTNSLNKSIIKPLKEKLRSLEPDIIYKLSMCILPQNCFFDNNEISYELVELAAEKDYPLAYAGLAWFHKQGKYVHQNW